MRSYAVFHAKQLDGIPPYQAPTAEQAPWTRPDAANVFLTNSRAVVPIGGEWQNVGKLTVQEDGTYDGEFHTLKYQFRLRMVPCDGSSDKHPVYRVYSGKVKFGAAWENVAEETGQVYYTRA